MRIVIPVVIFLILDFYAFFGLKSVFSKSTYVSAPSIFYIVLVIISYVGFFTLLKHFGSGGNVNATLSTNLIMGFWFSFLIFKLLFSFFLVFDDLVRVIEYVSLKLFSGNSKEVGFHSRRGFIVKVGLGISSIPFASLLYGITKGKYNYKVKNVKLKFSNLPKAFDGFKLVQISDIHSGSFDSIEDVQRGVDLVNQQNADVVFFTGDLVNSDAREIEPYIDVFKSIESPYGTYSILGNHDYGTHKPGGWNSEEAKHENFKLLQKYHKDMNFSLLKNEHVKLKKDNEEISILGVENWGNSFMKYGDLDKALEGVDENAFKILLSHDPSHWDLKTIPHKTQVDLTLSGHTHGMQFGIEIPGFKWSPVKYKYPRWSGLYEEAKQYLYVNKGFGFLGYPGRVGMWPEITVIELTC